MFLSSQRYTEADLNTPKLFRFLKILAMLEEEDIFHNCKMHHMVFDVAVYKGYTGPASKLFSL